MPLTRPLLCLLVAVRYTGNETARGAREKERETEKKKTSGSKFPSHPACDPAACEPPPSSSHPLLSTPLFRSERRAADNLLKQLRNKEQQLSPSATAVSRIGGSGRFQPTTRQQDQRPLEWWWWWEGGSLSCFCRSLSAGITLKHLRCCNQGADVTYVRATRPLHSSWRTTWPPSAHLPSPQIIAR